MKEKTTYTRHTELSAEEMSNLAAWDRCVVRAWKDQEFRQKLIDQRQQITRRLDELREELRGLEQTPRELEEWAQEEKDRDILIRLEDRETEELRKIQAALGLIDRKEYGYCQNCGKPIPRARLEELPTAFRCVDCTS